MSDFDKFLTRFLIVNAMNKKTGNNIIDGIFDFIVAILYILFLIGVIIFLATIFFALLF